MMPSLKDKLRVNQAEATSPRSTTPAAAPSLAGFRDRMPFKDACRLPVSRIVPDPDQPRKSFDDAALERTARSLASVGQLVPIIVRHDAAADRFVIIDGERRWRAAGLAGLPELSAVVDNKANEATVLEIQLVVNALREDVNPMEQARAWERLARLNGKSLRELAEMLNYDHTVIGRKISLLDLPEAIQAAIEAKQISQETGIGLTQIADPAEQAELAARARAGDLPRDELRLRIARGRTARRTASGRGKPRPATSRTWKRPGGLKLTVERSRGIDPMELLELVRSILIELEAEGPASDAA